MGISQISYIRRFFLPSNLPSILNTMFLQRDIDIYLSAYVCRQQVACPFRVFLYFTTIPDYPVVCNNGLSNYSSIKIIPLVPLIAATHPITPFRCKFVLLHNLYTHRLFPNWSIIIKTSIRFAIPPYLVVFRFTMLR